jgi:hypothetical protein
MRWTLWRRARSFVRTNGAEADGKGVWSWPPDAEVKSRGDEPRGDGGKKARSPAIRFTHFGASEWFRI